MVAPGIATAAPAVPTLLSPTGGVHVKNVVLSWSKVTGASTYQVQVSDRYGNFDQEDSGSEDTRPSVDVTTSLTSYAPSAKLPQAGYFWRVRVSDSVWSAPASFIRDWDGAPTNPHIVADNVSDLTQTGPTLTWGPIADASYYEVQYSPYPFVQGTDPVDGGDGGVDPEDETSSCLTASTVFTPYRT